MKGFLALPLYFLFFPSRRRQALPMRHSEMPVVLRVLSLSRGKIRGWIRGMLLRGCPDIGVLTIVRCLILVVR